MVLNASLSEAFRMGPACNSPSRHTRQRKAGQRKEGQNKIGKHKAPSPNIGKGASRAQETTPLGTIFLRRVTSNLLGNARKRFDGVRAHAEHNAVIGESKLTRHQADAGLTQPQKAADVRVHFGDLAA